MRSQIALVRGSEVGRQRAVREATGQREVADWMEPRRGVKRSPWRKFEGAPQVVGTLATITLCHLLLATLLSLALHAKTSCCVEANADQMRTMDEFPIPAFSPTRAPTAASRKAQTAPLSSAGEQIEPRGSSGKFSRTNELDVFLDDMNHSELRAAAAGQPIGNLFQPKPAPPADRPAASTSVGEAGAQKRAPASGLELGGLQGSQSEQQIYSECALILQRTYVKNIDDPK